MYFFAETIASPTKNMETLWLKINAEPHQKHRDQTQFKSCNQSQLMSNCKPNERAIADPIKEQSQTQLKNQI